MLKLKPVSTAPIPCKICQQLAPLYGIVDFNRCCEIPNDVTLAPSGDIVAYRRCTACGFRLTDAVDP
jgi:hypothetical protein